MVIGDMFSAGTLAIAPIAEKQRIVLLSPTASALELTNAGDYIFRIYPSDSYDGMYLANFSWNKLTVKTASIIYLQVASISAVSQVFKERFEALGGKILNMDSYKEGDTDFRSQLIKARKANADIIFIPGYLREMATLLRQAKELGIKKQFLSISTFFDPKIIELAGGAAEGVLFSAPVFDPDSTFPKVKHFVNLFESKHKKKPDILAGYGYDVVNIATEALKRSSTMTPDNIKSALYSIKDFPGVTGKTSFDSNGDVVKDLRMMQVKNNKFTEF
jgi:branched-chain amino acid transport system substrate-binding protein